MVKRKRERKAECERGMRNDEMTEIDGMYVFVFECVCVCVCGT